MGYNIGLDYTVEYVKETTFGTMPANPAMALLGKHSGFGIHLENEIKDIRYLPDNATTDKFSTVISRKTGAKLDGTIEVLPENLNFINDLVYMTGSPISFSIGEINKADTLYSTYTGCVVKDFTLDIKENDWIMGKINFMAADLSLDNTTDYIGTGTHATDSGADVLTYDNVSSATWAGTALEFKDISVKVSYDLVEVKDLNSTNITKTVALVPKNRSISASITLEALNTTIKDAILNDTKGDLAITVGTQTMTLSNVGFKGLKKDLKPEDLVSIPLETTLAKNLTIV